jgi:hypothetical protein
MNYHCYADNTEIYIVVEPRDNLSDMSVKLMSCLSDICEWMCSNLLKLNQDKTEIMIFAPKHRPKELTDFSISFGGNIYTIHRMLKILVHILTELLVWKSNVMP